MWRVGKASGAVTHKKGAGFEPRLWAECFSLSKKRKFFKNKLNKGLVSLSKTHTLIFQVIKVEKKTVGRRLIRKNEEMF